MNDACRYGPGTKRGTIEPSLVSAVVKETNHPVVNEIWQGKVSNLLEESTVSNGAKSLAKVKGNDMYRGADLQSIGDYIEKGS